MKKPMDYKVLREDIRAAMNKKGYGNLTIAKKIGCDLSTVRKFLSGRTDSSVAIVFAIAETVGMKIHAGRSDSIDGIREEMDEIFTAMDIPFSHLSEKAGVHWRSVRAFIYRNGNPHFSNLILLCEAMGMEMWYEVKE